MSTSFGVGATVDAKPYIFYSTDKQSLTFDDLKGRGEQANLTIGDGSGSIVWGINTQDNSLNYVGIGVGLNASYNVSWYDGYHIITVPLPYGGFLPIPVADRPGVGFPND